MAKLQANVSLFEEAGEGNLSNLQTQTFGLQINLCVGSPYWPLKPFNTSKEYSTLFWLVRLRMMNKINETTQGLQGSSDAIEQVYNAGVIDGFDKKPEA